MAKAHGNLVIEQFRLSTKPVRQRVAEAVRPKTVTSILDPDGFQVITPPPGGKAQLAALVSLQFREQWRAKVTIGALKLVDRGALSANSVGAMHGEIGHTQFLPGNVVKYGVGNMNLRDKQTALASTANFLKAHGWRAGAGYQANMGAIAGWNAASVYQQAIARIAEVIDGG